MSTWSAEDLRRIAETDDLHIAPFRFDGVTYGTPTWIWSVVVDDELYVRAYNGRLSRWYQAATSQGAGRIEAAGAAWTVTFQAASREVDALVDAAYRMKYGSSPYLAHMLGEKCQAATVLICPDEGA
jgi:hypothetical protein